MPVALLLIALRHIEVNIIRSTIALVFIAQFLPNHRISALAIGYSYTTKVLVSTSTMIVYY